MPTSSASHPTVPKTPNLSRGFREILKFCAQTRGPYSEHDIKAVNAIYRCVQRELSSEEHIWTREILKRMACDRSDSVLNRARPRSTRC